MSLTELRNEKINERTKNINRQQIKKDEKKQVIK